MKRYICECNKEFSNSQSLYAHYSHCKIHRQAIGKDCSDEYFKKRNHVGEMSGWNKFTVEQKHEIAIKAGKTLSENIKSGKIVSSFKGKKHTDQTKEHLSKVRHEYLRDGKQHGAWKKDKPTYLEQWFIDNIITKYDLCNKFDIVRECTVIPPYFMDFAFININLDVELDGKWHYTCEANIKHDAKRTNVIIENGWKVYRITWDDVKYNDSETIKKFLDYIHNISSSSKILINKLYENCEYISLQ